MNRRRLLPLGLAVAVLLALAGIASHGRPLAGGGAARGPTATFFDYVATTLVIFAFVMLGVVVYALAGQKVRSGAPPRGRWHLVTTCSRSSRACARWLLVHSASCNGSSSSSSSSRSASGPGRSRHARRSRAATCATRTCAGTRSRSSRADRRHGGRAFAGRRRSARRSRGGFGRRRRCRSRSTSRSTTCATTPTCGARSSPRTRGWSARSAARGLPAPPAEAPFEYVERALPSLDTSAESVRRLTDALRMGKVQPA